MRKRKAPEPPGEDPQEACSALLRVCVNWTDRCGRKFLIHTSRVPEKGEQRYTQRVGKFDRLKLTQLMAVITPKNEGYSVTGFQAMMDKGEVGGDMLSPWTPCAKFLISGPELFFNIREAYASGC